MVRIFLSAVTGELKPSREIAARVLRTLGYEAVYQDEFPVGAGDLRQVLRDLIDPCVGVLQLVGYRYGAEPREVDAEFGRVSYTQFEAEYARQQGKKVWYILLEQDAGTPGLQPEDEVKRGLQLTYRERVEQGAYLYHQAADTTELELKVHQLHDELRTFRDRVERRGRRVLTLSVVGLLLAVAIACAVWAEHVTAAERDKRLRNESAKLAAKMEALQKTPFCIMPTSQSGGGQTEEERLAAAYGELEKKHGLQAGSLAKELPLFAKALLDRPDTSAMDRSSALYIQRHYAEAEQQALIARNQNLAASAKFAEAAIKADLVAGQSARAQVHDGRAKEHYERGLEYFYRAASTANPEQYPELWADAKGEAAYNLGKLGRYQDALQIFKDLVAFRERKFGPEHASTLTSMNNLAVHYRRTGDYAAAETLYRRVLEIRKRTNGDKDSSTLISMNNLGNFLSERKQYVEAEKLLRFVLEIKQRKPEKDNPSTLTSMANLGRLLNKTAQKKEAEDLLKSALEGRDRRLGSEHPSTLTSVHDLAVLRATNKDDAAAKLLFERALEARERTQGKEHPYTLNTLHHFAEMLHNANDDATAKKLYKRALEARERKLGKDDPDTCETAYSLALLLKEEGKEAEAHKLAQQAYEGWLRTVGPADEDTLKAERLSREIGAKLAE